MKNIVHITLAALVMLAVGCKQGEFSAEPTQGVGDEVVVELPALVVEQPAVSKSTATDQVETSRFGKSGSMTITRTVTEGAASEGAASKASWHEDLTNVWVFQFTSGGAKLQGRNVGSVAVNQPLTTTLSLGKGTTIYIIANGPATGLDTKVSTETALLNAYETLTDADGDTPRLSGKQTGLDVVMIEGKAKVINNTGRSRTIQLSPNAASVNLDLDISKVVGATLTSVELCKVPERKYVFMRTTAPAGSYLDSWGSRTSAPYSWSIPHNLQGVVSAISSYEQRTHDNAPSDATYLRVVFKFGARTACFDLFLGESVKDFNVRDNYLYNIKMSIVGTMDDFEDIANVDDRVVFPGDYTTTPSNCYASYPIAGAYQAVKFNALKRPIAKYVKGSSMIANAKGSNPSTVSADATLGNDIVYQSGDKVEVVWQTAVGHATGGSMVIKSVNLTPDGIALVQVNGAGNAVVAYKRGSTILWNYHIWATDSDPFVAHATANTGGNVNGMAAGGAQARFMDRNLGALSATTAKPAAADAPKYLGLLYQYGRTTPFTGQGVSSTINTYPQIYNQNGSAIAMNNIGGFTVQANIAVSNVITAIQNPMNWYYKDLTSGFSWNRIGTGAVWNDYGVNKSIYDPCPYGYRVPKNGSWTGFTSQPFTSAIDGGTVSFGTWWPATGFRFFDSRTKLDYVGSYGEYWSSSVNMPENAYSLEFGNISSALNPSNIPSRSIGLAIRCVQEGY